MIYIMRPPDPGRLSDLSSVVRSSGEQVLELRLSKSGHWRESVSLSLKLIRTAYRAINRI